MDCICSQLYPIFKGTSEVTSVLSIMLGFFSLILPGKSIGFYQWIMKLCNWNAVPIDMKLERRNTRLFGALLVILGFALLTIMILKF